MRSVEIPKFLPQREVGAYTASEKVWALPNLFTRVYTRLEVVWSPKPLRCRYNRLIKSGVSPPPVVFGRGYQVAGLARISIHYTNYPVPGGHRVLNMNLNLRPGSIA